MPDSAFQELRLGDLLVAQPQSGIRQQEERRDGTTPYVTTSAVSQGPPALTSAPKDITQGDVKGRIVQRDDLLLVSRGVERHESVPCATVKFDQPAAFSESLIRLQVDQARVVPDYLRLYLTSRRGSAALAAAATGSVISNLRRDALQEVEVYLPDLATQRQIVEIMTNIESQLAEVGTTLDVLRDLFDTAREGFAAGILTPAERDDPEHEAVSEGVGT